jgi:GNAT superfamily N-acetyltransferase
MTKKTIRIRSWQTPEDYTPIAAIITASFWDATSPEAVAEADRAGLAQGERYRLAAVDADDRLLAYGTLTRDDYEPAGRYSLRVAVDPSRRCQGIGSALLRELESMAVARGGNCFDCQFVDTPENLAFATRFGYLIHSHQYGWTLDVPAFDETPFVPCLKQCAATGFRFVTLGDADAPTPEALYELERHANHDEPGYEEEPFLPFDQWYAETYQSSTRPRPLDCTVVAMDGDRPVAMSAIALTAYGDAHVAFTGVHREYRGRGLAQAVKLHSIRAAKRHGAGYMGTGNDERNPALLHLNAKLGFRRSPGMYWCTKQL